jgi:site-specific recombinase XerD
MAAPDRSRWTGQRDYTMMAILLATGFRITELLTLTRTGTHLDKTRPYLRCTGKGRKDRCTPLDPATAAVMQEWLNAGNDHDPLFPAPGPAPRHTLSRDGFQARLTIYWRHACTIDPSLAGITLTPHVFRHTKAMNMQMGRIASGASFRSLRERAVPAVQAAAVLVRMRGIARRGGSDLRRCVLPVTGATSMHVMLSRLVHLCCA